MIRQIQKRPPGTVADPLFLFHDASGTIANYYELGPIGRDVYAIADELVNSDTLESLAYMSRRYYADIKSLVSEGRILLGGWSLGGMIALQVAWIFAKDPSVTIDGVIMVDSPFPAYDDYLSPEIDLPPAFGPDGTDHRLERSMLRSVKMLRGWRIPVWRRERQPYTTMLCASQRVIDDEQPALSFVDQFRDSPTLGWNDRVGSVVDKSYNIPGHHFDLFGPENVASVTEMVATVAIDMELASDDDDD